MSIPQAIDANLSLIDALTELACESSHPHATRLVLLRQLRHALDHYLQLLDGVRVGCVDYDARRRDPKVEVCAESARRAAAVCRQRLATLADTGADPALTVRTSVQPGCPQRATSSLLRELQFLHAHALHHHAIMTLLAAGPSDVDLAASRAAATIAHQDGTMRGAKMTEPGTAPDP